MRPRRAGRDARGTFQVRAWLPAACACLLLVEPVSARVEKPTVVAEEFFMLLARQDYEGAAALCASTDVESLEQLKAQAGEKQAGAVKLPDMIRDAFFLMHGQNNPAMMQKYADGETIMPRRIAFYVPGQHYIIGNFAAVFTRETYVLGRDDTGPVREDPRKLWIDPTNVLSQVRDEAYFKQWWIWEDERLTMPGLLWMVKEGNRWKIDLFGGAVPRDAFKDILEWHFGRDVFEQQEGEAQSPAQPGGAPSGPSAPAPAGP